jgi:serine/threonine-protein kinase RsbW
MSYTDIDLEITVPNQTRYLSLIGSIAELLVREIKEYAGDREALGYHLNLVLTEALANAIEHSGCRTTNHKQKLRVHIHIEGESLCIQVFDQGSGFDLELVPDPDFEGMDERGRGIFFIRSLMDSVNYHRSSNGNCLEMHMKLQQSP